MAKGKNADLPYKDCPNCKGTGKSNCDCGGAFEKGTNYGCEICQSAWSLSVEEFIGFDLAGKIPCKRCGGSGRIKRV